MSSSRIHVTFTGAPTAREISAASAAKSGFDLRPKAPPRSGTCEVTLALSMPRASATTACAAWPSWVDDHTSTLSPLTSATAPGGSMGACTKCGV
jgi:hypothetical protein